MVIYFSGTGNSYSLAKKLSERIDHTLVPMKRAYNDNSDTIVFVFPLYGEDVPINVRNFMRDFHMDKKQKVMGICTSGGGNGNCEYTFNRIMKSKGITVSKFMNVVMTDNSMPAFFGQPVSRRTVDEDRIIDVFINKNYTNRSAFNPLNKIGEVLVFNPISRYLLKKKIVEDQCISCGVCEHVCPTANIKVLDGKVKVGSNCAQCLGCIHACPKQAIYMRRTITAKSQYTNVNIKIEELNR